MIWLQQLRAEDQSCRSMLPVRIRFLRRVPLRPKPPCLGGNVRTQSWRTERGGAPGLDGGRGGCGSGGLLLPLVLLALAESLPLLGHQRYRLGRRLLQKTTSLMAQARDGISGWKHNIITQDINMRFAELMRHRHLGAVFRPAKLHGHWKVRPQTAQEPEVLAGLGAPSWCAI